MGYPQQVTVHAHSICWVFQYHNGYRLIPVYILPNTIACVYILMKSLPPPPPLLGRWDNFMGPWRTLNFHLPLWGLSQMGELKFSTRFWGDSRLFSNGGTERVLPLLAKSYSFLPPEKVFPEDSPHQIFIPIHQRFIPPNPLNQLLY